MEEAPKMSKTLTFLVNLLVLKRVGVGEIATVR